MESKLKHLELIQGVVNRLATDSFRVKGWAVVLVAALFVLLAMEDRLDVAYIALAPVLVSGALTATTCGKSACSGRYTTMCGFWTKKLRRVLADVLSKRANTRK